jgi:hypothetical protein
MHMHKGLQLCWFWRCFLKLLQLNDGRPSSSGLRGCRRTYLTILKRAWSASEAGARWPAIIQLEQFKEGSSKPAQLYAFSFVPETFTNTWSDWMKTVTLLFYKTFQLFNQILLSIDTSIGVSLYVYIYLEIPSDLDTNLALISFNSIHASI